MSDLLALSLNPTRDLTLGLDVLSPGRVHRAARAILETAGKPVNAARAFQTLGGRARVLGFCGAEEKDDMALDFAGAGLKADLLSLRGRSRICVVLPERSGRETVINTETGLALGPAEIRKLEKKALPRIGKGDWVLVSGSFPPSLRPGALVFLIRKLKSKGAFFALDQRGPAFVKLLGQRPEYVQANRHEYAATFGKGSGLDPLKTLANVLARGAGAAAFLNGERGAYLSTPMGSWRLVPPRLRARSPIGAGDSFMAGILYGRCNNLSWPESLRWAGAAAAANVMTAGACRFSRVAARAFLERCKIQKLP